VERDIVLPSQNGGLINWWAPSRSGIWGPGLGLMNVWKADLGQVGTWA